MNVVMITIDEIKVNAFVPCIVAHVPEQGGADVAGEEWLAVLCSPDGVHP